MEIPVKVIKPVTEVIVDERRQKQQQLLIGEQRPTEVCYVQEQPRTGATMIYRNDPTDLFYQQQQPKITVVEEEKKQIVVPQMQQNQTGVFNGQLTTIRMNPTETYINQLPETFFDEQKHWFVTVDLQKETTILNTPIRSNNVLIKIKQVERVLKIRVGQTIRRLVRIPENINMTQIRVHLLKDTPKVVIVAPWTGLNRFGRQQVIENELELLEEERLMETEPLMYKLLQQTRCQLPKFIKVRGMRRCPLTGEFKLVLDLVKTGVRAEQIKVLLKDMERTLIIRAELEQLRKEQELEQIFQIRRFHHEIQLPTFVDAKRVQLIKVNTKTLRMELPIFQKNDLINTLCNKVEQVRMF